MEIGPALAALCLGHHLPLPTGTTVLDRIDALHSAGLIDEKETESLARDVNFLSSVDHAVQLATGSIAGDIFEIAGQPEEVGNLLRRWGLIASNNKLADHLHLSLHRVHSTCVRLAGLETNAVDTPAPH